MAPPEPSAEQVRIRVVASAVNPVDLATRAGVLHAAGLHGPAPVRLGWDVYGTVEAVGPGVRRLAVGQPVIGLSARLEARSKAHADAVVLDEYAVAAVPSTLDAGLAATLPLAGLTALQSLDLLDLRPGQSLLVTGVGGSVGSFATQLALLRGLRVVAAGRPKDQKHADALGAHAFTPVADLAERVRDVVPGGVDGALDAAILHGPSLDSVRDGGSHVSLVVRERPPGLRGIRSVSQAIRAGWEQLTFLGALADSGVLTATIAGEYELAEVRAAHVRLAAGSVGGRLILRNGLRP